VKILVTGSTSKIGIKLIEKLQKSGYEILHFEGKASHVWKLGERIPNQAEADVLIHLAHDRKFSIKENIFANQEICSSFAGPKIFLSSLSAHKLSISKYGISKFECENIFLNSNSSVLRAGVVYGSDVGGIFETLNKMVKLFPIIPLPYKGINLLYTSHIDDLINEIIQLIAYPQNKVTLATNMYPISFYNLVEKISELNNLSRILVPIHGQPIEFFLQNSAKIFPSIAFIDSLLSLSKSVPYSELSILRQPLTPFREFLLNDLVNS
jgi:nucleoside-diphosphate-sugar epimerase